MRSGEYMYGVVSSAPAVFLLASLPVYSASIYSYALGHSAGPSVESLAIKGNWLRARVYQASSETAENSKD